jgi:hypothetical protein
MKYLAIYGLIYTVIGIALTIMNSENKGLVRFICIALSLPILIFFLGYLNIV